MAKAGRDDFSEETKRILAFRVACRCSRPDCQMQTAGPTLDTTSYYNIGVAAHITAAASGGKRYDESLSPEQRKHPDNGIWLCQNHGKEVDDDDVAYPVDLLRRWKKEAEARAKEKVGKVSSATSGERPIAEVTQAERYGLATMAYLEDGRQLPMAGMFDPAGDKPTFFANPSFVVRFSVYKLEGSPGILVTQILATVYNYVPLPKYRTMAYALPVRVNPYIVALGKPIEGKPRPCIAELRYHDDHDGSFAFAPLRIDSDTPEVFDVRFNAREEGIYKIALDIVLARGADTQTYRVFNMVDVLFCQ